MDGINPPSADYIREGKKRARVSSSVPAAAQQTQLPQLHSVGVSNRVVIFYHTYEITPATDQGPAELSHADPEAKDHPIPTDLII